MERETGSFIEGIVPLSAAIVCVCGNTDKDERYVNCNEDGIPFSIWEAWESGDFARPEGFSAPPETPYGFCVLCPVCGRYYSEKEIEITGSAVVSGRLDPEIVDFKALSAAWKEHNREFFAANMGKKKARRNITPRPPAAKPPRKNPLKK